MDLHSWCAIENRLPRVRSDFFFPIMHPTSRPLPQLLFAFPQDEVKLLLQWKSLVILNAQRGRKRGSSRSRIIEVELLRDCPIIGKCSIEGIVAGGLLDIKQSKLKSFAKGTRIKLKFSTASSREGRRRRRTIVIAGTMKI